MRIRADFARREVVPGTAPTWVPSPLPGVERCMLDRVGAEQARATSLVRYAPGSAFSPHVHGLGEEYIVLEGIFTDEDGDHGPGCYVRNPPGSRHTPSSGPGCLIFVKLRQMRADDRHHCSIPTSTRPFQPLGPGRRGQELYRDVDEQVFLEHWDRDTRYTLRCPTGAELLVLDGALRLEGQPLGPRSWIRAPAGDALSLRAGDAGVRFWLKQGGASAEPMPPARSRPAGG